MTLDELREHAIAYLSLRLPPGTDPSQLIDECLSSARRSLRDDVILSLSPQAWGQIALVHISTFLDTGQDVSVGEIAAAAIRDALHLNRLGVLAQQLAQEKAAAVPSPSGARLTVVRS